MIPGVEFSTTIDDLDIHILGYYVDFRNPTLQEYVAFYRDERAETCGADGAKLT